ncbi:MAG: hypothetical protein BV459_05850 [Thermoplasmata archaeon M11B2D]|nr:MAG: hypothetical protein BV459_05850 [Thermoplasmata archaeon M11B2D]PNX53483.1 MAG: hypothetical protein BV458_04225 [Thermoplasmata archaeon M9B2D]
MLYLAFFNIYTYALKMSKWKNYIGEYMVVRRYLKKGDRMRREDEVPHERRKDCLVVWCRIRMGCGKRREEMNALGFWIEGRTLPQADSLMGLFFHRFLRGEFMFFIPSPLCHAFLPGNTRIN